MITPWLCHSLERIYPWSSAKTNRLHLDAARGAAFSFQVGVRIDRKTLLTAKIAADPGLTVRLRRVGYVPLFVRSVETPPEEIEGFDRLPGLVPDILHDDAASQCLPPGTASAYWISGTVAPDCRPGLKQVRVTLTPEACHGAARTLVAAIRVYPVRLQPRRDFDITHWFYADALCDWYRAEPWSEAFWQIVQPYFRNVVAHEQNTIYVPVFTPPLDGVKRPTQLLDVRPLGRGRYAFDWSQVSRWIATARRCGLEKFEWCHLFSQWGVKHALRIYRKHQGRDVLLWDPETPATGPVYRAFLAQFLPAWHDFLVREKLMARSYFHLSDEPHGDEPLANYRAARALLRELAPWMNVMDALSDIRFAREKLVDLPIPVISTAKQFVDERVPCWSYFCCAPQGRYLNRLLETPLAKIRGAGWLFYRFGHGGFLHWGYNYWYRKQTQQLIDPFLATDGEGWPAWAAGDPFVVYPGPQGPLDSIRWEVFAESMQDYRLLQTRGVPPARLARDFHDYDRFPKTAAWYRRARRRLLAGV